MLQGLQMLALRVSEPPPVPADASVSMTDSLKGSRAAASGRADEARSLLVDNR
jgi:hypothetical protein